ncbi:MAG: peptidase signal peptidase [Marmoricola sp.]|nr:peptidase signal peptidase [Marmoricola sp.]
MPEVQAAGGASLSTDRSPDHTDHTDRTDRTGGTGPTERADGPEGPHRGSRGAPVLALGVGLLGLLLDLGTKQLAVRELTGGAPVRVLGEVLQLRLIRNPGAAFSAGASVTPVISVVAIVAAVVVLSYVRRVRHRGWAVALGLLLAGVVGNLTDRLFRPPGPLRGHVVDFLALPNWPIFNVADVCIDLAAVLLVVLLLKGVRLDGTRHEERS